MYIILILLIKYVLCMYMLFVLATHAVKNYLLVRISNQDVTKLRMP